MHQDRERLYVEKYLRYREFLGNDLMLHWYQPNFFYGFVFQVFVFKEFLKFWKDTFLFDVEISTKCK